MGTIGKVRPPRRTEPARRSHRPIHRFQALLEERIGLLDAYSARLEQLETTPRLFFHPREDYGPHERLLPHITPRSGFQHRPGTTPGQTR